MKELKKKIENTKYLLARNMEILNLYCDKLGVWQYIIGLLPDYQYILSEKYYRKQRVFLCDKIMSKQAPEREISIVMRPDKPNPCAQAKLLYRTPKNQPYDVAVLRVDPQNVDSSIRSVRLSQAPILKGECFALLNSPYFIDRHRKRRVDR